MHCKSWIATAIVLGATPVAAIGCGSSKPPPPVFTAPPPPPPAPVRASGDHQAMVEVGSAGGTLELSSGARLEIPSGSFETPTLVTLQLGQRTTAFSNTEYQNTVGPVLSVSPDIAPPEGQSVVVSFPFSAAPEGFGPEDATVAVEVPKDSQRAFGENTTATRWQYVHAAVRNGRMMAELPYLPGMRLQFLLSRDE